MPAETIQGKSGLPENTERSHKPGLCLTDELELRFLENLREHGRTEIPSASTAATSPSCGKVCRRTAI